MRKTIFTCTAVLIAAVLAGCQKGQTAEEPETWPALTGSMYGSAAYYGDDSRNGLGLFRVTIADSDLEYDTGQDSYTGKGDILSMYFNTPLATDPNNATIPEGDYTEGTSEYTFSNDGFHTSIVSEYDGEGGMAVRRVLAGNVSVKESVGLYWIICDLLIDIEGEAVQYKREFVGKIRVANNSEEGFISNLSNDVQCLPMNYCELVYQDINTSASSKTYSLFMATDYNPDEGSFEGDAILIYLNTGFSAEEITEGTYTVIPEPYEESDLEPGTIMPGGGTFESNYGTWFFSYNRQLHAQIKSGTVRITGSGDGTYSITAALKDGNGYTVTASYNGDINIY